jgi:hypothetical protein
MDRSPTSTQPAPYGLDHEHNGLWLKIVLQALKEDALAYRRWSTGEHPNRREMREMHKPYDELQTVITPEHTELEERTREGQGVGVSRSAYSRVKCFFCEKGISSNALAQTNHKRMHVREGMIVELRYTGKDYRPNSFIRPDHAEAMLKTGYYSRVAR